MRFGILGSGKAAALHAEALRNIPECRPAGVWSPTFSHAQDFGRKYSIQPYSSLEAFISESGAEAVTVTTPHPYHAEHAVPCLKAGISVLVEKPLASNLYDCDKMIQTAEQSGAVLGTVSQRRWYPSVKRIREAIDSGKIGRPVLGNVTILGWRGREYYQSDPWRGTWDQEGGGILVNQAPHQLDLFQWFLGPVQELCGYWDNMNHPEIEVEDTAAAVCRFQNGAVGTITASNSQNPALYGRVHIFGENGAALGVQTDGGAMFIAGMSGITEAPYNDIWTVNGESEFMDRWKKEEEELFNRIDGTTYFHTLQIKDFVEAVKTGRPPAVTGREGRKTVELFTAIYRSRREKKPISFPINPPESGRDFDGRLLSRDP
ncbi:MAG: Gfo/Idh/MocA family protein [Spirochaetia bacterium]